MLISAKRIKAGFLAGLSLVMIVLPSALKVLIYRHIYGFKIGDNVKIGLCWISAIHMEIENDVIICNYNRFKNIPVVRIGHHSIIGKGNTFTSTYEFTNPVSKVNRGNHPELIIGEHCGIALLHYFDVQDTVIIGAFTTIAGKGSVFFTHFIDVNKSMQSSAPISIGRYCMIGSNVSFTPGANVADYCVVGMGAVVTKPFLDSYCLIGGNPAKLIRNLSKDAAYFHRSEGWIGLVGKPLYATRRKSKW